MGLLFSDSWSFYDQPHLPGRWDNYVDDSSSSVITVSDPYGRNNGSGARIITGGFQAGGRGRLSKFLGADYETLIVGVAIYCESTDTGSATEVGRSYYTPFLQFLDESTVQLAICLSPGMRVVAINGPVVGTHTVLGSTTYALHENVWHYIEVKATFNNVAGSVEIRVDGAQRLLLSPVDTQTSANGFVNSVQIGAQGHSTGFLGLAVGSYFIRFDDVIILDTGGAQNNDFLGDSRVEGLRPNGAGLVTQLEPSGAGGNFSLVDDLQPDDDTTYVAGGTVGNLDLYTFTDLETTVGLVRGVTMCVYAEKTDAGVVNIAPLVGTTGAPQYTGTSMNLQMSYNYKEEVLETNPVDGGTWAVAKVNSFQYGVKRL